ncbi:DNA-binding response OmpR family regulator/DNA-binding CsgD family transcriptional regulator [Povalibacter uvarum]|uniref:DNA-binding response OmpR family regulator/DNA-binding CsgD family transcriptional regulator n=1 Tax=Povalibacter uvarum TaxID=732238 RepID=A0A841HI80_9GAMM|nr:response regulator transcription factor [Povalibacter uvarum]MBB6092284.1 DNA-binding response OmpR family regulator/DNA-binding CsgD family transcriptional regulator [Povalibacter uvarum]
MANEALRRDTVLVVDDTPETLGFLTDTLDHAGFTVLIATDGEAALDLVDQITPDLVLMDAVMPGMNGFEACRRLKREKLLAQLPVIFMTGLSQTEHVVEGLAAGGVDYVTKPIVVDELLARIRVHLANARIAHGTHAALDATGRFLLATDRRGRLLWCTPKARQLLSELFPAQGDQNATLPPELITQLMQLRQDGAKPSTRSHLAVGGRRLEISMLSSLGPDELLFRLTELVTGSEEQVLQQSLSLTSRESEVLLWISRGKSNREIGEILTISPRTVNKHLEQVFVKLGVENRASAAARAVKTLGSRLAS